MSDKQKTVINSTTAVISAALSTGYSKPDEVRELIKAVAEEFAAIYEANKEK